MGPDAMRQRQLRGRTHVKESGELVTASLTGSLAGSSRRQLLVGGYRISPGLIWFALEGSVYR